MPAKLERCVQHIQEKIEAGNLPEASNPWAICQASVKRTDPRYDLMVRHLGYEPMENIEGVLTDKELIDDSQQRLSKVKILLESTLNPTQQACLDLARSISSKHDGLTPVHPSEIPPASDRVKTAGLYRVGKEFYIDRNQLLSGRATVETIIHELPHHTSGTEDGTDEHNAQMISLTSVLIDEVKRGTYDDLLRNPAFVW